MKLCFFRQTGDVPLDGLSATCRDVGTILGVGAVSVDEPLGETDPDRLLEVSGSFLERGESIAAVVLTAGVQGQEIIGEGVGQSRARSRIRGSCF